MGGTATLIGSKHIKENFTFSNWKGNGIEDPKHLSVSWKKKLAIVHYTIQLTLLFSLNATSGLQLITIPLATDFQHKKCDKT